MAQAWEYLGQAEDLLTTYFRDECENRMLPVEPDSSLVELCQLVVDGGDTGLESMVVKVRAHFLRRARLLRLDRDLDAATRTLDVAATLPDYPFADEFGLDYNEPMERLRSAIARGDFADALARADKAEAKTGPRRFYGRPTHPPIGIIVRAELRYLCGTALAGSNESAPDTLQESLRLIESAIWAVHDMAESMEEPRRAQFLNRFVTWQTTADLIRRQGVRSQDGQD